MGSELRFVNDFTPFCKILSLYSGLKALINRKIYANNVFVQHDFTASLIVGIGKS